MKKAYYLSISVNVLFTLFFIGKRVYYTYAFSPASIGISRNSEQFISPTDYRIDSSKICKIKKVLILGNSIVKHGPLPEIGWEHNWGMAATKKDSDFVHLLIHQLNNTDTSVSVKFENIAEFERNFKSYDFQTVDSFQCYEPDMIIIRISENVNADSAIKNDFIKHYDSMLTYLDQNGDAVKIIVEGFWRNDIVNRMLYDYAYLKKYAFVSQSPFCNDSTKAIGEWKDPGIQQHPNNLGMLKIKESIWAAISPYFQGDTKGDITRPFSASNNK